MSALLMHHVIVKWVAGEFDVADPGAYYRTDGCALVGVRCVLMFRLGETVFYWATLTGPEQQVLCHTAKSLGLRLVAYQHLLPMRFCPAINRMFASCSHADLLSFVLQVYQRDGYQARYAIAGVQYVTREFYNGLCTALRLVPMPQESFHNWLSACEKLNK